MPILLSEPAPVHARTLTISFSHMHPVLWRAGPQNAVLPRPGVTSCMCRYGYRAELHALLSQLVRDMDRKVERQRERAAKENEPRPPTTKEQEQLDTVKASPWALSMSACINLSRLAGQLHTAP